VSERILRVVASRAVLVAVVERWWSELSNSRRDLSQQKLGKFTGGARIQYRARPIRTRVLLEAATIKTLIFPRCHALPHWRSQNITLLHCQRTPLKTLWSTLGVLLAAHPRGSPGCGNCPASDTAIRAALSACTLGSSLSLPPSLTTLLTSPSALRLSLTYIVHRP
jgi:hypothetical protein